VRDYAEQRDEAAGTGTAEAEQVQWTEGVSGCACAYAKLYQSNLKLEAWSYGLEMGVGQSAVLQEAKRRGGVTGGGQQQRAQQMGAAIGRDGVVRQRLEVSRSSLSSVRPTWQCRKPGR
jgi:hypothetical protein